MKYWVYILKSVDYDKTYVGFSNNLERRLYEHNAGKTIYTRRYKPWKIVYKEEFKAKTDAIKREKFLKKQKNREFYNKLILNGVWRN